MENLPVRRGPLLAGPGCMLYRQNTQTEKGSSKVSVPSQFRTAESQIQFSKPRRHASEQEFDLREPSQPGRTISGFPQVEGRAVKTIRFCTEENAVSIRFGNRTRASFHFETGPSHLSHRKTLRNSNYPRDWHPACLSFYPYQHVFRKLAARA